MNTEIVPGELRSNFYNGYYHCYGKCVIKLGRTKQWRKATMHGRTGYERYCFEIEPCPEFPVGGSRELSTDGRWNDDAVLSIRMVPEEMWNLPVRQDVLSELEILIMKLRERSSNGERVQPESRSKDASDWRIVCIGNDSKYGRVAYSPSLDIMRSLTFDEFYGGGIVD